MTEKDSEPFFFFYFSHHEDSFLMLKAETTSHCMWEWAVEWATVVAGTLLLIH